MKRFIIFLISISFVLLFVKSNDVEAVSDNSDLKTLLLEYYNNGVYIKNSKINLNQDGVEDLAIHFHVDNYLERTTYYAFDSLWMSHGKTDNIKYSYYGTSYDNSNKPNGVTYAQTYEELIVPNNAGVVLSGEGQNSMEEYYTTLYDITQVSDSFELIDDKYVSKDSKVLKYFLDFTAPCLYESIINTHVFDYQMATIEVIDDDLVLKLLVSALEYGYILNGVDAVINGMVVLSEAKITSSKIKGEEVDTYPSYSNADVVTYNGDIYTYGGSSDGYYDRSTSIYRFDPDTNKLYLLDVKLAAGSTSHRVYLRDNKVYIFGGLNLSGKVLKIQIHDLVNQTIKESEVPLTIGLNCAQVGGFDNKVFFVGGSFAGNSGNSILMYDFDLNEMRVLDIKLPEVIFKGGWCAIGKYLYLIGGTGSARIDKIYRFDMETYEIKLMDARLSINTSQSRAVYDGEGNIYIYGGTTDGNILVDKVYKYNILEDSIIELDIKLPIPLANVCVARVNDVNYILGGENAYTNLIYKHEGNTIIKIFG